MRQFVCLPFVKFEVIVRMHCFATGERDVVGFFVFLFFPFGLCDDVRCFTCNPFKREVRLNHGNLG